ncbi:hypothetical protein AVEN_192516-1 [Araneus ventricosus]|uniref:Transposable element Tc1 transposase n=1 Tax=Araneus ventricosus TaxID=182803 RepID=A0A4Y2MW36_ARAVE|nr:hypothetical protein AVEN_192516-1 [Araneus ventricosus]
MWSDESRFSLFQNDGRTRVRREPYEAMGPSCIVPTVQANGGSIMIWSCFNGSGLGSATLCDSKMKSQHYLNMLNGQVIPSMDFSSPMDLAYSRTTMPRSTEHLLFRIGSGNMRAHFPTLIGHYKSWILTQSKSLGSTGTKVMGWFASSFVS